MNKVAVTLGCFCVIVLSLKAQQNQHYSTYMFNHFSINPAYCGSKQTLYLNTVQRYQWLNFGSVAPRTQTANVQFPNKQGKIGLGLSLVNDQVGARLNQSALFTYAYHFKLPPGRFSLGLRSGVQSVSFDLTKVNYQDKSDSYNNMIIRKVVPTGDFGVYYYTSNFYTSFALNNFWGARLTRLENTKSYSRLYTHLFFTMGRAFMLSSSLIVNPSIMIKKTQASPIAIDYNCNFRLSDRFWTGISYRSRVAMVVLAQVILTDHLRIGYSYDIGLNKIGTLAGATHEFYLGFDVNVHNLKIIGTRYL